ncbi:hypothetical protein Pan216_14680 [Planctomycetes bacterium Pan216]|uniref:DUF697 domain-containing protein n=1 Tax=Kolteria novifilia TaxID=2527975 RepID=A0A518B0W5_9BACT|nr:hypothetical protein Pan216_14680 [Planctomycetes bacterium Pan216]
MSTATQPAQPSFTLWNHLHRFLATAKLVLFGLSIVVSIVFLGEVTRLYEMTHSIHPFVGYLYISVVVGGVLLVAVPVIRFLLLPKVVEPPKIPEADSVRPSHLRAEAKYMERYLKSCSTNEQLKDKSDLIANARDELAKLSANLIVSEAPAGERVTELAAFGERTIPPILVDVDNKVDRLIYQESLAVGVATALSPNGALDAFVMLWRSVRLVTEIAVLYYGRPGFLGTFAICRDVSIATALAGVLQNVTDSLGNLLARSVGGLTSAVAGPVVDGSTNALVLIRIGYLAKERCRSLRRWDARTRKSAIISALKATQSIAFGVTSEIARCVGGGIVNVAGKAADSAYSFAAGIGQSINSVFRANKPEPATPDAESSS